MYLAIDVIMGLIEKEEWFEDEVDYSKITDPKTSVMTVFEILKINNEACVDQDDLIDILDDNDIEILSLDPEIIKDVQTILNKHADLFDIGSLESIHIAHSSSLNEAIVSTNPMYGYLETIDHIDPRKL